MCASRICRGCASKGGGGGLLGCAQVWGSVVRGLPDIWETPTPRHASLSPSRLAKHLLPDTALLLLLVLLVLLVLLAPALCTS